MERFEFHHAGRLELWRATRASVLTIALVSVLGCASGAPPKAEISSSELAIQAATSAGAAELAPEQLAAAEQKLESARALMKKKKYERANRLLQQAVVDAELAESEAMASRRSSEQQQLKQSVDQLTEQLSSVAD